MRDNNATLSRLNLGQLWGEDLELRARRQKPIINLYPRRDRRARYCQTKEGRRLGQRAHAVEGRKPVSPIETRVWNNGRQVDGPEQPQL